MHKIIRICFLLVLVLFFSCEDQTLIITCSDCTPDEPVTANLEAKFDPNSAGVLIQLYEGNLEDSILMGSYTTFSNTFTQTVILNKKYTLTATYYIGDKIYVAVDSAEPRVKYDKTQCNDPCYLVYDRKCDLRLKYTK